MSEAVSVWSRSDQALFVTKNGHLKWQWRAQAAASLIGPGSTVLDLGCGGMALKQFLPANCHYIGADIVARAPDVLVVDLNKGEFPAGQFDVIMLLGVIEYMRDPRAVLAEAKLHTSRLILSYHRRLFASKRQQRRKNARLDRTNSMSKREVASLLASSGWRQTTVTTRSTTWRDRHDLFDLAPARAPVHSGGNDVERPVNHPTLAMLN